VQAKKFHDQADKINDADECLPVILRAIECGRRAAPR
jgi:hypothetical protein